MIPESLILEFYERPLDMEQLLHDVEEYMVKVAQLEKRKHILVVDDDPTYLTMIMDCLKDTYRISLANSGVEAITWLAKYHADLILLDYEMPLLDGGKLLELIRFDASLAPTPVMFLTGKDDKEHVMAVLPLKPVDYILKSIADRELKEKLAAFFAAGTAAA